MHVSVFPCAEDCLTELVKQRCDVLITDVRMKGMDGMSLLHEVRRHFPSLPTIVITGYGDIPLALAATKAGAVEFLEKPLDRQELLAAVQRALTVAARPEPALREELSDAEVQVLQYILDGRTNREIATTLNRSTRTVEAHRRSIMHKFGTNNIAGLVQRAIALGLGKSDRGHP